MGWVWAQRSCLYLSGVGCLVLATLGFGLGHVAPFWLRQDAVPVLSVPALGIGLWYQCPDVGGCFNYDFATDPEYMKAARILQVLGLLGLVVAVVVAVFDNCRHRHPGRSFFLEGITGLSALLGFSGAIVYLGYTRDVVGNAGYLRYDWAFALNVAAAALALFAAAVILIANLYDHHHKDDDDDDDANDYANKAEESPLQWQDVRDPRLDGRPLVGGHPAMREEPYTYAGYDDGGVGVGGGGVFVVPYANHDRRPLPDHPPRDYFNDSPVNHYVTPGADLTIVPARPNPLPRWPRSGGSDADARRGLSHANSRSWQEGMEVVTAAESPSRRRRYDERRVYGSRWEPAVPHLPAPGLYEQAGPVYSVGSVYPARSSPAVMELTPFVLPRVVVRGRYEPGYGYPEYAML